MSVYGPGEHAYASVHLRLHYAGPWYELFQEEHGCICLTLNL